MVKRAISFLNKEFSGINEAAILLGSLTLLSQILGLVRDRLLAHVVHAGPTLDVYYASFRIPDFLYVSVASLASITVLMPFLSGKIKSGNDEARKFISNVFSAFMLFMVLICTLLYFMMGDVSHLVAPGFDDVSRASLVKVSRLMLLSPIFIGLSNLFGTVTQLSKKFFIFSLSPVFYNVGIIFGIIFLYPHFGVTGLAYGVIIGAILHLLIQIPSVLENGLLPKFVKKIDWQEIRKISKVSLPRTLTLSLSSLVFISFISIASKLMPGSISLFTFAFNLQSVPVGIIGISYSVAIFPSLVRAYSDGKIEQFRDSVRLGILQIIFWSLPVATLFIVLRAQIVRVVLGSSQFTWTETKIVSAGVALFVISLVSQSLVLLLVRAYYAFGETRKPLFVNLASSLFSILSAFLLIKYFSNSEYIKHIFEKLLRVENIGDVRVLMLPLAYSLGSLINVFVLWAVFRRDFFKSIKSGIRRSLMQILFASILCGITTYYALRFFDNSFAIHTFSGILSQGFFSGVCGLVVFTVTLSLMQNKEYLNISTALSNKLWKKPVLAPEQVEL